MTDLAGMLAGLVDHQLEGAACSGKWELFDPADEHESRADYRDRAREAVVLCHWCPVADACAQVLDDTPRTQRHGVWAGTAHTATGRPLDLEEPR